MLHQGGGVSNAQAESCSIMVHVFLVPACIWSMMKWWKSQHGNQSWPQGDPYDITHVPSSASHALLLHRSKLSTYKLDDTDISKHPMIEAMKKDLLDLIYTRLWKEKGAGAR